MPSAATNPSRTKVFKLSREKDFKLFQTRTKILTTLVAVLGTAFTSLFIIITRIAISFFLMTSKMH